MKYRFYYTSCNRETEVTRCEEVIVTAPTVFVAEEVAKSKICSEWLSVPGVGVSLYADGGHKVQILRGSKVIMEYANINLADIMA